MEEDQICSFAIQALGIALGVIGVLEPGLDRAAGARLRKRRSWNSLPLPLPLPLLAEENAEEEEGGARGEG